MFYSSLKPGFYSRDVHGDGIPADAVEISDEEYSSLLAGQSAGQRIVGGPDGFPVLETTPPPTVEQLVASLTAAVQAHIDARAAAAGYDNIYTACTYADEPSVPKFQAEGQALRAWRSWVWAKCHEIMADVQAGKREIPSADRLIAELPDPVLP